MNIVSDIYSDYEKTLCFTGHRPDKLGGYNYRNEQNLKMLKKLRAIIIRFIEKHGITTFISGMALGVDIWSARIVLSLKDKYPHIKLICAIPCAEQYKRWHEDDISVYYDVLESSDSVYYVSNNPYTAWCMNDRNKWMVDNSKFVIAVWNNDESGGTWQTIKYAKKRQRLTIQLNPRSLEINFLKND